MNDRDELLTRITAMEEAFDAARRALDAFEPRLAAFENAEAVYEAFAAYYGSEEWFAHYDADAAGELPGGLKRGVLGEDLGYELLCDYHDVAVRMLDAATNVLKAEASNQR